MSFTFPNEGLQYLNDAYRNVTISHTKYIILMIKNIFTLTIYKNIFTYLHSLYTKIYLHYTYIHRSIYKQSRRPWTLGHHDQML